MIPFILQSGRGKTIGMEKTSWLPGDGDGRIAEEDFGGVRKLFCVMPAVMIIKLCHISEHTELYKLQRKFAIMKI